MQGEAQPSATAAATVLDANLTAAQSSAQLLVQQALSPALYCLDSISMRWARLPCSNAHKGGAIAVVGSTVFVGGGFDPANKKTLATDTVDLFTLAVQ
jgi:hypothetical protein